MRMFTEQSFRHSDSCPTDSESGVHSAVPRDDLTNTRIRISHKPVAGTNQSHRRFQQAHTVSLLLKGPIGRYGESMERPMIQILLRGSWSNSSRTCLPLKLGISRTLGTVPPYGTSLVSLRPQMRCDEKRERGEEKRRKWPRKMKKSSMSAWKFRSSGWLNVVRHSEARCRLAWCRWPLGRGLTLIYLDLDERDE